MPNGSIADIIILDYIFEGSYRSQNQKCYFNFHFRQATTST